MGGNQTLRDLAPSRGALGPQKDPSPLSSSVPTDSINDMLPVNSEEQNPE